MDRQKIRTVVGTLKRYDVSYDCTLPDFLALIDNIVAEIPEDERDRVKVDWTDGNDCDSGYIEFEHWREETDDEMKARTERERVRALDAARSRELRERMTYERLKQKYGRIDTKDH